MTDSSSKDSKLPAYFECSICGVRCETFNSLGSHMNVAHSRAERESLISNEKVDGFKMTEEQSKRRHREMFPPTFQAENVDRTSKDVVQRLRDWDTGDDHTGQRLLMEAADELERLRAALKHIAVRCTGHALDIAQQALRGAVETSE